MKTDSRSLTKKRQSKKIVFILLLAFILWIIWGNTQIQVTNRTIQNEAIPENFDGYKIAQISDLHNKNWGSTLIKLLEEENPDIIVITGDLIDSSKTDLSIAIELIDQIKPIAPIYFVTGNHEAWSNEYGVLEQHLLEHGVAILDNDKTMLQMNEDSILLFGLQDPSFTIDNNFFNDQSIIDELVSDFDGYKILLSHRPELFDFYVKNNIDLVFSGHAHGGQIRIPFVGGLVAPDQGWFPEYTSGIYQENETSMVVSRGLGNSIIPFRVNNTPELVIIQLEH